MPTPYYLSENLEERGKKPGVRGRQGRGKRQSLMSLVSPYVTFVKGRTEICCGKAISLS
jgi:hypothetical protein